MSRKPQRKNDKPYMFYLSEEQLEFIREQSQKHGQSQAEYCRRLIDAEKRRTERNDGADALCAAMSRAWRTNCTGVLKTQ